MKQARHAKTRQGETICKAETTTTGDICHNTVAPGSVYCHSGHKIISETDKIPARNILSTWRTSTNIAPPTFEEEDAIFSSDIASPIEIEDSSSVVEAKRAQKHLKPWKGQALGTSVIASMGTALTSELALTSRPWSTIGVSLVSGFGVFAMTWWTKRRQVSLANEMEKVSTANRNIIKKRAASAEVTKRATNLIERIKESRGSQKSNLRGQLLTEITSGIYQTFPTNTSVVFYEPSEKTDASLSGEGLSLKSTPLNYGWLTSPPPINSGSGEMKAIRQAAHLREPIPWFGPDGRSTLFAPVLNGREMLGVIRIDAPSEVIIDQTDISQVASWSKLIGLS